MKDEARNILARYDLCDSCLGRQFAALSTGLTNRQRGASLRRLVGAAPCEATCVLCGGIFQADLDRWVRMAVRQLCRVQYGTFVVGSRPGRHVADLEQQIASYAPLDSAEALKTEFNREVGKLLWRRTCRKVDLEHPDVLVLFDLLDGRVDLELKPLFVFGYYRKLVRTLPQTRWRKFRSSVEQVIAAPLVQATRGTAHALHGGGREDIDVRCLGWRPFVLEISEPAKRRIHLARIERLINRSGRVKVRSLERTTRRRVAAVKADRHDKTYRVRVRLGRPFRTEDVERMQSMTGVIDQETPMRVVHRRTNMTRRRALKRIACRKVAADCLDVDLTGEAGLYIKELVTGDDGRTRPSLAEVLDCKAEVLTLDVLRIHRAE